MKGLGAGLRLVAAALASATAVNAEPASFNYAWLGKTADSFSLLQLPTSPERASVLDDAAVLTIYRHTMGSGGAAYDYEINYFHLNCGVRSARLQGRSQFLLDGGGLTDTLPEAVDRPFASDARLQWAAAAVCGGEAHPAPRLKDATPRTLARAARGLGPG